MPSQTPGSATEEAGEGNRLLREIRLFELSLCPVPANPLALVTSVKSLAQVERFMQSMRGKSPDAEMLAHLQAIHDHVLSLLGDVDDDDEDGEVVEPEYGEDDVTKTLLARTQGYGGDGRGTRNRLKE